MKIDKWNCQTQPAFAKREIPSEFFHAFLLLIVCEAKGKVKLIGSILVLVSNLNLHGSSTSIYFDA